MGPLEAGDGRGQERVARRQEGTHLERPALESGDRSQVVLGGAHLAEDDLGVVAQPGAGGGDADGARPAVDERQAQLPLQRRDMVRDDGLRVAELETGGRERAVLCDGVERSKTTQIVHR